MSGLFKVLQDVATEAAASIAKIVAGDSTAGKNGLLAFGFKDSSGNAVLPQLSATGAIPVTSEDTGTEFHVGSLSHLMTAKNSFELVGDSSSVITMAASEVYSLTGLSASSFADGEWKIVHYNGTTEVILYEFKTGAGHYNYVAKPMCEEITAVGATDEIRLYFKQLEGQLETVKGAFCALLKA